MDLFASNVTLSYIFCIFFIYSFFGWIFESLYCTIGESNWANRGFLFGPICPIYGIGALTISVVYHFAPYLSPFEVFAISFIGSIVLEWLTSYFLERWFHARWWDYGNMILNVYGRISLLSSLGFGFAGIFVIFSCNFFVYDILSGFHTIVLDVFSYFFVILMTIDVTLTVNSLIGFERVVTGVYHRFNSGMNLIVSYPKDSLMNTKRIIAERQFIFPLLGRNAVHRVKFFQYRGMSKEHVQSFIDKIKRLK